MFLDEKEWRNEEVTVLGWCMPRQKYFLEIGSIENMR
jgi:hypothetical protein